MAGIVETNDAGDARGEPTWRLDLLGTWRLTGSGEALDVGVNGRRLFALLALRGRCDRAYVAGALWPECSEPHAQGNLRATLSRLHRRDLADPLACSTGGVLALRPEVEVDLREVVEVARAVLDGDPIPEPRRAVRRLISEDLLLGWYDDWVLLERERLRQLRLHALEQLSARLLAAGDTAAAVEAALEAVTVEPLRESAHAALIRAHLAEGNRAEATRQLHHLSTLLRKELGEEPSRLVTDLLR
jgi:DNA-binding SARP family transcriptional activator